MKYVVHRIKVSLELDFKVVPSCYETEDPDERANIDREMFLHTDPGRELLAQYIYDANEDDLNLTVEHIEFSDEMEYTKES